MTKFRGRGKLFRQNCHRKYVISTGKPMALPTFWAIDRTCSSKIDGVVAISKFGLFWPGDLVPWPTYLSMSHTRTAHPFHMWTKFADDLSKRSWVMLDKTDRLTDRQTDRQMKGQSEIAYLPKFANMMLIVMVMVITEILYIILIFDCFENQ